MRNVITHQSNIKLNIRLKDEIRTAPVKAEFGIENAIVLREATV